MDNTEQSKTQLNTSSELTEQTENKPKPNDGWKSRKLWLSFISIAFTLGWSATLAYQGKLAGAQWVDVAKWVPQSLLLIFGGLEAAKFVLPFFSKK